MTVRSSACQTDDGGVVLLALASFAVVVRAAGGVCAMFLGYARVSTADQTPALQTGSSFLSGLLACSC